MWENLITPLLTFAGVVFGILGKGFYDTKFRRLDDAAQIRKELRDEIGKIKEQAAEWWEMYQAARERITDLDIACARCFARLEECAEVIARLLEAEELLDAGNVKKARAVLRLVETDRGMREQMERDRGDTARSRG